MNAERHEIRLVEGVVTPFSISQVALQAEGHTAER